MLCYYSGKFLDIFCKTFKIIHVPSLTDRCECKHNWDIVLSILSELFYENRVGFSCVYIASSKHLELSRILENSTNP